MKTAGAKINDNTIVYDNSSVTTDYFTVTGMTATTGASVNVDSLDNITDSVTLGSGNVSTLQLSIGGGNYNISLNNSVSISKSNAAYWSLNGGDVYYTSDETLAGFSVSSGSVIPYVSVTAATKFTIDGLNVPSLTDDSLVSGVSLDSSGEITLYSDAFNNLNSVTSDAMINLTSNDKYSLTLASGIDTAKSVSTVKNWKPSSDASLNHVDGRSVQIQFGERH